MKNGKNDATQKMTFRASKEIAPELRALLVKVLMVDAEQNHRIDKAVAVGVELEKFRVDLLDIVLDALGVPPDTSAKPSENADQPEWMRPDYFCRDHFGDRWYDCKKTRAGIEEYLHWVVHELNAPVRN